jgi:hypothetical protein
VARKVQGEEEANNNWYKFFIANMPQGGPGNCGGNLNGSGGSKRKMGGRQKLVTTKVRQRRGEKDQAAAQAAAAAPAFQVNAPPVEQRAAVLRAQEELDLRSALRRSHPVEGTAPGGEVLGGRPSQHEYVQDVSVRYAREARLQYFQKMEEDRTAARASRPATGERRRDGEEPLTAARRAVEEVTSGRDGHHARGAQERVARLLDLLADRIGNAEAQKARTLLCSVLSNAEAKGSDDRKYLRLKSRNDKLWHGLLRHPECFAVLELGGFAVADALEAVAANDAGTYEISRLQVALQEQLEGPQPNPTVVETLMLRLEQLTVSASPPPASSRGAGEQGCRFSHFARRLSDLLHPGGSVLEAAAELREVSQGTVKWERRDTAAGEGTATGTCENVDSPQNSSCCSGSHEIRDSAEI